MRSPLRRIITGACFFVCTILGATMGYTLFGCSLLDAVYMVVITVFGVGYGEFCPTSPPQRVFTMLVIVGGAVSVGYIVGGFVQMVAEGEIREIIEQRRKTKDLAGLQNHTIICGFGRIGQVLARQLEQDNQLFVVVDNNGERVASAEELGYRVCTGNATDEHTLETAGIKHAKVLATVLPDDAVNVFITLTARGLNPNLMIVARGELPSTEKKLLLAGADHVVLPAGISGLRIANLITHPTATEFFNQTEVRTRLNELLAQIDVQMDELVIPPHTPLVSRTVGDLEIRGKGTFIVVALQKKNGEMISHPKHSVILDAGDTVVVLGHRGDIPQFTRLYEMKRQIRYRGGRVSS
jgi:voltage-gated potassium channel